MENNGNNIKSVETESLFRKFLKSEISTLVFIVGFIASIIWFQAGVKQDIALMKKDIDLINNNHLTTLQKNVDEIKEQNKTCENRYIELDKKLIKIMVKLGIEE